ncbi:MAG: hypothetical protein AMJ78_07480 [Omnitrophica WOR_2 bacterium SM23_29]|nr:MAG: hypothetical protein AMJ78_07480 [Omnitrophica WOR_2 bacterium SM23_29]
MRIVFFGTSDFAVPGLVKLNKCHRIAAVVTKPDKPKGRHLLLRPSLIKLKAQELNIPLFFIEQDSHKHAIDELKRYDADLFVVIAYGGILPSDILSIPKFYSMGVHASLLPKYRGAAPINWAILNGNKTTGVTVFKLSEKMDTGDIILQRRVEILDSDDAGTLSLKLSEEGANLLLEAMELIEGRKEQFIKQREEDATYAPRLRKEDGAIDWTKDATYIHNQVRAMYMWPGASSNLSGRAIKIWRAFVAQPQVKGVYRPGEIIKAEQNGILVACGKGVLSVKVVQLAGGKQMSVSDFLQGHKISAGDFFL